MTLTGPASVPPTNVCEVFKKVVKKYPSKPALRVKRNGEWVTWTFKQYYLDVARGAKSMIRLGLEPHNGVCVLGFNSPEWFIAYLCGIMVGLIVLLLSLTLSLSLSLFLSLCMYSLPGDKLFTPIH